MTDTTPTTQDSAANLCRLAYAIEHASALQAENDKLRELIEVWMDACCEAQAIAPAARARLVEVQAENHKLRATSEALLKTLVKARGAFRSYGVWNTSQELARAMADACDKDIDSARASITGNQG